MGPINWFVVYYINLSRNVQKGSKDSQYDYQSIKAMESVPPIQYMHPWFNVYRAILYMDTYQSICFIQLLIVIVSNPSYVGYC